MTRKSTIRNNRKQIISIIVGTILLIAIIGAVLLSKHEKTVSTDTSTATSSTSVETTNTTIDSDTSDQPVETVATTKEPVAKADPDTLRSVDIEPLGVKVFYTQGVPGFSFVVKRTANKTQYVEFYADELIGTKCTDDEGLFVSIIKNPDSDEDRTTISQSMILGDSTYGLSLAGKGCTSNTELLDQYQTAFKEGFSSLEDLKSE